MRSNFVGINYNQVDGNTPPDPMLAVGLNEIVESVNASFQILDKSGHVLASPEDFDTFVRFRIV